MTSDNAEITDEGNWIPIPPGDELLAPPPEHAPPLPDPAPPLLNTHQIPWETFERLVLRIARVLDGARDVKLYGTRGQAQHGIDVVGFFDEKAPTIYQAKRVVGFTPTDLEAAVDKYGKGRRPFKAERIVIAVATEAHDTQMIEKLDELRRANPDIKIDLWDQAELSEILRDQSGIVTTFFGPATSQRFCGMAAPVQSGPAPVSADAILRGPIAHLGLQEELRDAEAALVDRPGDAALAFAAIAQRLEEGPFAAHAVRLRDQQATALVAAGSKAESAQVRLALGWSLIDAGDPFSAQVQARHIADQDGDLPESLVRSTNALAAAATLRHEHRSTLEDVASDFDDMVDGDLHRAQVALFLAEEAVASQRPDIVAARAEVFSALAAGQPATPSGQMLAARLRMCVADCDGDWAALASEARLTYPQAIASLVLARYSRHLALTLRAELSVDRWLDAIERACAEEHYDDAADWLYAVRAVKVLYGFLNEDLNDFHRRALALRASGGGTILPEPYRARERALANFRDEKWPDALESLRQYLWRSTIGADWAGELEAHERLGDLFAITGRPGDAVRHLIYSGQGKKLESLAAQLPDASVRLSIDVLGNTPWQRSAAFQFAAAVADLLHDEDAAAWASAALTDILANADRQILPLSHDPLLAAFKAFGNLSGLATEDQARAFLALGERLVPRQPNTYRFTDEPRITAVIGIARAHPELRREAVRQLLQALLVDQRMGDLVLSRASDLLRAEADLVAQIVTQPASENHFNALIAIIVTEVDATQALGFARERVTAATAPREHEPGVVHFGSGVQHTALLASVLPESERVAFARAMLVVASDVQEPALNRQEALLALRVMARSLPGPVRDEAFRETMRFAAGDYEAGRVDDSLPTNQDPLPALPYRIWPSVTSA